MDGSQKLALAIVHHLNTEVASGNLGDDAVESLDVAIQCLEQAYNIEGANPPANKLPLSEIYHNATIKAPPSPYDKTHGELLKTEGNNFMKLEQYDNAIQSYTSAIEKDGTNAVYYCNRAAAHTSKGNYGKAISDCEEAVTVDPQYGKAYGRMGLAALNAKDFQKAKSSYEKALTIEPSNATYQANLDLANGRLQLNAAPTSTALPTGVPVMPPGTGGGGLPMMGGLDLSSLLSNPAVMNMAQSFMQNPQMQNMFTNMMGNAQNSQPAQDGTQSTPDTETESSAAGDTHGNSGTSAGFGLPQGLDFNQILGATQGFAQQMREQNPDLVDQLRDQFRGGDVPPSDEAQGDK